MIEAEGIADGHDPLADAHAVRVAKGGKRQRRATDVDLDERDVGALIAADHARRQLALVVQPHANVRGVLDDVVVGKDVAAGVYEDAGALLARVAAAAAVLPLVIRGEAGADDVHHRGSELVGQPHEGL